LKEGKRITTGPEGKTSGERMSKNKIFQGRGRKKRKEELALLAGGGRE